MLGRLCAGWNRERTVEYVRTSNPRRAYPSTHFELRRGPAATPIGELTP
jgi:hypothetical protein